MGGQATPHTLSSSALGGDHQFHVPATLPEHRRDITEEENSVYSGSMLRLSGELRKIRSVERRISERAGRLERPKIWVKAMHIFRHAGGVHPPPPSQGYRIKHAISYGTDEIRTRVITARTSKTCIFCQTSQEFSGEDVRRLITSEPACIRKESERLPKEIQVKCCAANPLFQVFFIRHKSTQQGSQGCVLRTFTHNDGTATVPRVFQTSQKATQPAAKLSHVVTHFRVLRPKFCTRAICPANSFFLTHLPDNIGRRK